MSAGEEYAFSFTITNPGSGQESPSVSVEASGDAADYAASAMTRDTETSVLGIAGGASPLKVVEPVFTTKRITQSTPASSASNVITVSILVLCLRF